MGYGKAHFGRKSQKKHLKLEILISKFVPWDLKATRIDLEAGHDRTLRQPAQTSRQAAMIGNELSLWVASRSQGTNFETKIFNFRWVFGPPTEMSLTTPHYYPKYEVWAIKICLW